MSVVTTWREDFLLSSFCWKQNSEYRSTINVTKNMNNSDKKKFHDNVNVKTGKFYITKQTRKINTK